METVTASVSDNARYSVFGMADSALQGNTAASLRMLHGLRGEGTEPAVVLWSLAREVHTLYAVQQACDRGKSRQQALNEQRVWKSRMPLLQAALSRHSSASLAGLIEEAALVDGSIKGYADGNPWDRMERLITALCAV